MFLGKTDFGPVWGASGVTGFFGEGYWFHRLPLIGADFGGMTFVSKTTTLNPRAGNMRLAHDFTPKELFPECIWIDPIRRIGLNAVSLSGPGASELFKSGGWQKIEKPFFLSFASIQKSKSERILETIRFKTLLREHLPHFNAPVGLQVNFSCPNAGLDPHEIVPEAIETLKVLEDLYIPLVPKFNALVSVEAAKKIAEYEACSGLCISNAIPFGEGKDKIHWEKLFPGEKSPLEKFGGGALSGAPLLNLVIDWVTKARKIGITKPINAGGGVMRPEDVFRLKLAGASSVFVGSVAMLRPWRVQKIIRRAHTLYNVR